MIMRITVDVKKGKLTKTYWLLGAIPVIIVEYWMGV